MRIFLKFTLIELLTVIAVIAILASLLFPALGKARDHSKTIRCCSNSKQIAIVLEQYLDDYNRYYPPLLASTSWLDPVYPYTAPQFNYNQQINNPNIWRCSLRRSNSWHFGTNFYTSTIFKSTIMVTQPSKTFSIGEVSGKYYYMVWAQSNTDPEYYEWYIHDGKTKNILLFVDGHVNTFTRNQLMKFTSSGIEQ